MPNLNADLSPFEKELRHFLVQKMWAYSVIEITDTLERVKDDLIEVHCPIPSPSTASVKAYAYVPPEQSPPLR